MGSTDTEYHCICAGNFTGSNCNGKCVNTWLTTHYMVTLTLKMGLGVDWRQVTMTHQGILTIYQMWE